MAQLAASLTNPSPLLLPLPTSLFLCPHPPTHLPACAQRMTQLAASMADPRHLLLPRTTSQVRGGRGWPNLPHPQVCAMHNPTCCVAHPAPPPHMYVIQSHVHVWWDEVWTGRVPLPIGPPVEPPLPMGPLRATTAHRSTCGATTAHRSTCGATTAHRSTCGATAAHRSTCGATTLARVHPRWARWRCCLPQPDCMGLNAPTRHSRMLARAGLADAAQQGALAVPLRTTACSKPQPQPHHTHNHNPLQVSNLAGAAQQGALAVPLRTTACSKPQPQPHHTHNHNPLQVSNLADAVQQGALAVLLAPVNAAVQPLPGMPEWYKGEDASGEHGGAV